MYAFRKEQQSDLSAIDISRADAITVDFACSNGSQQSDQELSQRKQHADDCQREKCVYLRQY